MARPLLLALALAWACAVAAAPAADDDIEPKRPVWPAEFQISWNFTVPYIDEYQKTKGRFSYAYEAWQDTRLGRQKVVRNGKETVILLVPANRQYEVFPAYDHLICWEDEIHGGTGPTLAGGDAPAAEGGHGVAQQRRRLQAEPAREGGAAQAGAGAGGRYLFDWETKPGKLLHFLLPDLSEKRWQYVGTEVFKETGASARVYEWDLTAGGTQDMRYRFYVSREGAPLRLWMLGTNLYSGGHKDEYVATYHSYRPGPVPDEAFELPDGIAAADCVPAAPDAAAAAATRAAAASGRGAPPAGRAPGALRGSVARHMPAVHWGDAAYDAFAHRHGRRHRGEGEYHARRAEFARSAAFVARWSAARAAHLASGNASAAPHAVALNHLADWTREEYLALVRPERATKRLLAAEQPGVHVHEVATPPHMVPAEVIWRGTPADSPVKDQAACGSCWSFSTVGALEAAWYRATGAQLLFSEQHMIDCSWEAGNSGCYGGDQIKALNWVLRRGGLAANADYPYVGINDFCRADAPSRKFKGKWVLVEGGEEALKEAVLTKGPMIVSIDASDDSFRFYSGGVYSRPACATAPADLDHAVIVSGYGVSEGGQPYWLVKNIWSPYWGEDGYMRVARSPNDCGVASEPVYLDITA